MAVTAAGTKAPTWTIKGAKFPKFYKTEPGKENPDYPGFRLYTVILEQRNAIK